MATQKESVYSFHTEDQPVPQLCGGDAELMYKLLIALPWVGVLALSFLPRGGTRSTAVPFLLRAVPQSALLLPVFLLPLTLKLLQKSRLSTQFRAEQCEQGICQNKLRQPYLAMQVRTG